MNSYNNRFGIQLFTARKMLMEIRILLTLFKVENRRKKRSLELKSELCGPGGNPAAAGCLLPDPGLKIKVAEQIPGTWMHPSSWPLLHPHRSPVPVSCSCSRTRGSVFLIHAQGLGLNPLGCSSDPKEGDWGGTVARLGADDGASSLGGRCARIPRDPPL